ncbi:MAG: hypothetical protein ABIG28_03410 [archaeon]
MSGDLKEMFEKVRERLVAYMKSREYEMEIATTFNFVLHSEFEKAGLKPVFVGQYFVDYKNPTQTRVFCHQGTEACSPLPISGGVVGRAIRTGENQYVADVTQDESHVNCDPNMQGTEFVIITWGEPYSLGEFAGKRVPIGVLDLDFNVKSALSKEDCVELEKIWVEYGKKIFPGEAKFQPGENISVR